MSARTEQIRAALEGVAIDTSKPAKTKGKKKVRGGLKPAGKRALPWTKQRERATETYHVPEHAEPAVEKRLAERRWNHFAAEYLRENGVVPVGAAWERAVGRIPKGFDDDVAEFTFLVECIDLNADNGVVVPGVVQARARTTRKRLAAYKGIARSKAAAEGEPMTGREIAAVVNSEERG